MSKIINRASQTFFDLVVLAVSLALAFAIRFEGDIPELMLDRLITGLPYVVALQYACLAALRVPRFAWRYIGLRETMRIAVAFTAASTLLVAIRVIAGQLQHDIPALQSAVYPFGVLLIDVVLAFLGVVSLRAGRRVQVESAQRRRRTPNQSGTKTLLVGAGKGGQLVAREIWRNPSLGVAPIGFVDDDIQKVGTLVEGLPVLGTSRDVPRLMQAHGLEQALVTFAKAPGSAVREVVGRCEEAGLPVKIIPGLYEIVGGRVNLNWIRPVAIDDLLRREPVQLDLEAIGSVVDGEVVMVTGAGGSIGSELCRQLLQFTPAKLLLVERTENSLFMLHRELRREHGSRIIPIIADITDSPRMDSILGQFQPTAVFHAAAHKHVPMMEWNPLEAAKNNAVGSGSLARLAMKHKVERFVLISTDKAVNPTSVMGATKRLAEIQLQAMSEAGVTRFVAVRFGNVLGSAGSVIPIFQSQIAAGGPVTVTHPEMTRYFMTIPEACQLVLQAGSMGEGGEIFILDMGDPVKIVDLAKDLIRLSGLRPNEDIEIVFSGVRPGEKLFEELSFEAENADRTQHPKIAVGKLQRFPESLIAPAMQRVQDAIEREDPSALDAAIRELVPEFLGEVQGAVAPAAE